MNLFEYRLYDYGKIVANLRTELANERSLRMFAEDKLREHKQTHTCISDKRMTEYAKDGDTLHIPIIKKGINK